MNKLEPLHLPHNFLFENKKIVAAKYGYPRDSVFIMAPPDARICHTGGTVSCFLAHVNVQVIVRTFRIAERGDFGS